MIILRYRDRKEGHILAANYPEIAKQWNYEKNGALTPWDVTIGSNRKVWWKCSLGHEWEAVIFTRTLKSVGCPYCKGRCAWPGFNDLATLRPDIAAGWDYELNGEKMPERYTVHSHARVWWICPKGHPSFQMKITERSYGHGCPICGRETVVEKLGHPVSQLSSDGEMVQTYPSVAKAAEANGISRKPIMHVLTGRQRNWDGKVFRYVKGLPEEKPPVPDDEKLRDVLNQVVSLGDEVMFIKYTRHQATKILRGTVAEIRKKSVLIRTASGEDSRIIVSRDDPLFLQKVLVMRPRPERPGEGDMDASGYPVMEGDPVVYMALLLSNKCKGFEFGTVKKTGGKLWEVNGTRRTSNRIIVVNW